MQRIVFLNMYISLYSRISISARRGHESGLRTTCWFYVECTGVHYHNFLQNLNRMQRGETGPKIFFVEQYNDTAVFASKSTLRREHALGARGHGVSET